ncbi:Crp/Fnr family transcriptional regulator [Actinoplanes palleronii]|uniref:Cyclic nucleotide-binding protein n=1 Tax=Actinoplanes palleronii TaxID=113570 RepID=A0ABQ4BKB1_9ACTN|nr:Crp/Fnr family transcriptional regulator [Actinoplanes palleronii]GIE71120.1 cyclic nucleotide-binding protein [Actinoplanes palleronii]
MREESRRVAHLAASWSPTDWAALVDSGIRRSYRAGQFLLRQGEEGSWVAALIHGRVRVVYTAAPGQEILLAVRGPGDLLGEFGYGDREPRSASALAIEPCVASLVTDSRFTTWVKDRRTRGYLDRYILAKAREAADLTWRLTRSRPSQRLAALVLTIVEANGHIRRDGASAVPMSQAQLAQAIGVARSSITPILASWKSCGLVSIERSHMIVLDVEALRRELTATQA